MDANNCEAGRLRAERDRLLTVVTQVGLLGGVKLPLEGLLREVVRTAQRLAHAGGAAIAILDGDRLRCRAGAGSLEPFAGQDFLATASLSGLALARRCLVYSADTEGDSRVNRDIARQAGARSVVVAPLFHGATPLGVLKVTSERADAFDEIDEHAVQLCAQFVAAVLSRQQALEDYERLAGEHAAALAQARTVLAASPAATIVHDLDGRIRMWNPAAERLLGWSECEVLGKLPPFVPPGEMTTFMEFTRQILAGKREPTSPVVRQTKDGRTLRVRISGAPLAEPTGAVTAIVRVLEAVD